MKEHHNIKLIALDIDGTLITSDHTISTRTEEAIKSAINKGVNVMLSTGRSSDMCHQYIEQLALDTYLITASGAEIWSPTKEIMNRCHHEATLIQSLFEKGEDIGLNMWLISADQVFENGHFPTDFHKHIWLKIGFYSDDEQKLRQMKTYLSDYANIEITNSHPMNIEVNPKNVSKAHALMTVCEELGMTMDQVMAVGDSLNDYTMIKQAGIGVAMGNAQSEIKEIADYVTKSNDEDGVALAIEKFILKT